ncbi:MAG: molecular chaperone SurA [Burkholderiales bacterium]|jgi:peptidyl-prolyl cis-trans isomerase SurA|nr:molecular chaperone SurA [Burkholderiales bacterium]
MKLKFILCTFCFGAVFAVNNSPQSVSSGLPEIKSYSSKRSATFAESGVDTSPSLNNGTTQIPLSESQAVKLQSQKIKMVSKVVAFVNKGVITSNQVNMTVAQTVQMFKQKGITNPNMNDVRSKVIEQLIMQQIQLDLAQRSGIKTNDIEINDAINNMAKSQNMTPEAFKNNLPKLQGVTYDEFRDQMQKQIIMEKLKQREVDSRIVVNDDEVNRILNSEAYKTRIDYHLAMISITIPEQATTDVLKQRQSIANNAYNELKSGISFDKVAVKYSNAPNALSGGDLGWRNSAALPPVIANGLKDLSVDGYTNVIKLPVGFFIFKVNEIRKHGAVQIIKQYHVRHILIKVNENTSDDEAKQKISEIKAKLDNDKSDTVKLSSDFVKYAKQYSEDTSSINGGDLGWVSLGDTVPAFEQTMLKTPIGTVSSPVRSPFGWHILQVLEVRNSNQTNDREKAEIRQELRENKGTMIYTQWLRDIREMAYVKMNDD